MDINVSERKQERRVPWYVTAFGACVAALGISFAIIFGFGIQKAFAATEWPGSTFTYNNQIYPTSLEGVTVTFNNTPGAPDSYIGNSGGNIMWYANRYYPIGGFVANKGFADYWYSETSSTTNAWYVAWTNSQSTTTPVNFYDANHGWGNSNRTITFATGATLGGNTMISDCPILHLYDFIRYVVDNSDFRSRYTLGVSSVNATISTSGYNVTGSFITPSSGTITCWFSPTGQDGEWTQVYSGNTSSYTYTITVSGYVRFQFSATGYGTVTQQTNYINHGLDNLVCTESGYIGTPYSYLYAVFESPYPTSAVWQRYEDGTWITFAQYVTQSNTIREDISQDGTYRLIVSRSSYNDLIVEFGFIDVSSVDGNNNFFEDVWDDAWEVLQPIIQTFRSIFGTIFLWIPEELRDFMLAILVLLIVLGLISRIVA